MMTEIWLGLALLVLPLIFVILWPALRGAGVRRATDRRAALAALYRERQAELQAARESGSLDEKQFAQLEAEMARNLLAAEGGSESAPSAGGGRGLLIGLAVLLPVLAVGIYVWSGNSAELALYQEIAASQQGETSAADEARITSELRARAESHPEDLTSRYVLAQRLLVSGDLQGAVEAYRYVVQREPQAADVKAQLAQALFFANGSKVNDEVRKLAGEVLAVQPDNGTALGLAGIGAFENEEYGAARDYWRHALSQLPPNSAAAQALAAGVARAEKALADNGESPVEAKTEAVAEGPAIRVRVALADGVEANPATPVFIYARGSDSPMPLAIVRLTAEQLPAEVVLDESRAMMPGRSIANTDSVQLVARLAVRGDARPAPGDWQGLIESLPKADWSEPQSITIDSEL
ncbi:cytochrome c-type biogenesis protein CcmH [Microbulbifer donghaiensis]|uniref:Cytochrome c-type biogenesis protein CcmH n=1 Tax=Microbulbifer donghaiensis TaxID=494016 RepID=A0A1M5GJS8_9GAMM|nr:c-type cytochrome biogenesis protein CcmI [Microbulbifer donghaiensis]SHG03781.1 cytochrome c-type biogenesis protein CcmH [Microbulbifer donghaiensis]